MSYNDLKRTKCIDFKTDLAKKQYEITQVKIKGIKGITEFKNIIKEIDDLIDKLYTFKCEGVDYIYQPMSRTKKTSTQLKLKRENNRNKLFIKSDSHLPLKKRLSARK